jgi:hypothetical protein
MDPITGRTKNEAMEEINEATAIPSSCLPSA